MRARRTLVIAAALLTVAIAGVTQLSQTASTELLVSGDSQIGRAQSTLDARFGGEPVVVTLRGDLSRTLSSGSLVKLLDLEGRISRLDGVRAVYGPATFLNQTIAQTETVLKRELGAVDDEARKDADAARAAALKAGASREEADRRATAARENTIRSKAKDYEDLMVRLGSVGLPSLTNQSYVNGVVFGAGVEPKQRFRWLFPDAEHALILVRPEPGLGESATLALGRRVESLTKAAKFDGVTMSVGGFPLLAAALERETRSEILRLGPIAIGAMLLLLLLTLRRRRGRFVPLALALGGTVIATGLSWPLGLGLSVSTVAALPVVLGLALDFAVQLQARFWHERRAGLPAEAAALRARAEVGPTLVLAAGAMSLGFLVLLATSVPLLDRLGAFLALGTITSVALVLLVGPALLTQTDRGVATPLALAGGTRWSGFVVQPAVLAVLAGLAVGGLALSGGTRLETDLQTLAPPGCRSCAASRRSSATSGPAVRSASPFAPTM